MKPILIFRHVSNEGPGFLDEFLKTRAIPSRLICIDQGERIPADATQASGLVFMGGTMSVNDDLPWIEPELQLIRKAVDADIPVLGHCLGGQLISKALGGSVSANPVPEFGWLPVNIENKDAAGPWLQGLPETFPAFHWHGETFTIPEGATHILSSEWCHNQGFVIGNALALQCHIEMTEPLIHNWIESSEGNRPDTDVSVQSADAMLKDTALNIDSMQSVAEQLYSVWVRPLNRN